MMSAFSYKYDWREYKLYGETLLEIPSKK